MTGTETRNPFQRRGFIAAAIIVGVILLAAIIVLITSLTRGGNDGPLQTSNPSVSAEPSTDAADASVCGLHGYEKSSSLTDAPKNKWELVGTVAAPTDPEGAGPGVIDDGFRSCYAHTAEGALFAVANYGALATDANLRSRLPELVAPGPGRDALIEGLASDSTGSTSQNRGQLAAFKIGSYTGDTATIEIVLNYNDGRLIAAPFKVKWLDGDWKIVLADDASMPLAPVQLQNLGGYIPWAGA